MIQLSGGQLIPMNTKGHTEREKMHSTAVVLVVKPPALAIATNKRLVTANWRSDHR